MQAGRLPVILDVDTGKDDALALLLALRSPRLHVLGITCVAGNHRLEQVVINTLKTLDVAGAPEIPVVAGMRQPLIEPLRTPMALHGADGMSDLGLPESRRQLSPLHAVEWLRQTLARADEPVHLVALAPLTNLAVFVRIYPDMLPAIASLTIMGGTFAEAGNTSPHAEFNVRYDPEAAAIVLASGLPIRLYPWDVFRRVTFSNAECARMMEEGEPAAKMAGRILRHSCDFFRMTSALIGDAGAVATVIDPDGATFARYPISVELSGHTSRGMTVIDRRSVEARQRLEGEWWTTSAAEVDVCVEVDAERYRRLFAHAMGATDVTGAL
jgi:pyrimidine-specific ribonucleoside hydrolase